MDLFTSCFIIIVQYSVCSSDDPVTCHAGDCDVPVQDLLIPPDLCDELVNMWVK